MPHLFKTVALYLLMLAIPVQAFTATTMLHCGLAHQHTTKAQEPAHRSAQGHANNFAADQRHQLSAAVASDSTPYALIGEAVSFATGDSALAKGGDTGTHESSEHAACSAGAVVPASSLRFQPADQAIERVASIQFLNIAFVTGAPARPPRAFPA